MAAPVKIVVIGAGSASFGVSLFQDLFSTPEMAGNTVTLVDVDRESLDRMAALAETLNAASNIKIHFEKTLDRRAALPGADFVINAVAVDRLRLWQQDFAIPKKHGIRHTLGENGGPGGLFFTLRTMPLIFDFARDIEDLCPGALFINLSNPESRIVLGLAKYSRVRALGLCHGISLARWFLCQILDRPESQVELWGAGLNHFQWILHLRERESGRDLYPLLREREATHDPAFTPLARRLFRAFGLWPTCSDDHLGEYLAYGWEGGGHGYDFANDEQGRVRFRAEIDGTIAGTRPVPADWLKPSWGERAIAVIAGIQHNQKRYIESGIVRNGGIIANLDPDCAVEVPIMADAAGIHPLSLGPLPDGIARILAQQVNVQQLAVEAAIRGSKEIALQALLVDPVINSSDAAVKLLDELWEINRPYIRACV